MKEKKTGLWAWVNTHKKQLILAGVSIVAIAGIILGIKNEETLTELWSSLEERIKKVPDTTSVSVAVEQPSKPVLEMVTSTRAYTTPKEGFDVNRHIRTMSAGRHHSAEKAAEAAALGIELLPNQTLVDPYAKCVA